MEPAPHPVRAAFIAGSMDNQDQRSITHVNGKSSLNYLIAIGYHSPNLAPSICVKFDAMRFPVIRLKAARYFILSVRQVNPESRVLRIPNAGAYKLAIILERMSLACI